MPPFKAAATVLMVTLLDRLAVLSRRATITMTWMVMMIAKTTARRMMPVRSLPGSHSLIAGLT
jgi:hypothetical protein